MEWRENPMDVCSMDGIFTKNGIKVPPLGVTCITALKCFCGNQCKLLIRTRGAHWSTNTCTNRPGNYFSEQNLPHRPPMSVTGPTQGVLTSPWSRDSDDSRSEVKKDRFRKYLFQTSVTEPGLLPNYVMPEWKGPSSKTINVGVYMAMLGRESGWSQVTKK